MSSQRRSFQQNGRYAMFRHKKTTVLDYFLLVGVVAILTFCGLFVMLHLLFPGYQGSALRSGISPEKQPRSESQESGQCRTVCYTKECLRTAADILQMIDTTVDPCKDFYHFACGGYSRIPTEYKNREIYAAVAEEEAVKLFRELIKQVPKSVPEDIPGSTLTKIRKFYDSCVNAETSEENAVLTAFRYLEHFGIKHWPELLSDFAFTDPDLDEVLVRLALYGQHPFFEVRPRTFPFKNETGRAVVPTKFIKDFEMKIEVSFEDQSIFHKNGVLEKEKMILIEEILEYFVPNKTARSDILADVFSFDLAVYYLAKETNEKHERCESSNGTSECPDDFSFDCSEEGNQHTERWCKMARKILDRSGFSKKNSPMAVLLEDKEHFQELGPLIDRTNQRTIAHTLALQFFVKNAFFLNSALNRKALLLDEFRYELSKKYIYEMPEMGRSEFCTVWATYRLPILAETLFFISKYNNSELSKEVNDIYSDIKEISLSTVRETAWLDSKAKVAVEEVFSKLYLKPESHLSCIRDLSKVDDLYKEVDITEESFLANELESRKLRIILFLRNMDNFTKSADYMTVPFKFSPQYTEIARSINFELGTLVFPSVTSNRPRYINLGYFGAILGHELSHPVEIQLFQDFNETRSEVFESTLREKIECFSNHYSQYEIYTSGQKINGNFTFHEDMPDYLGILAAFKSLKKYQENHGFDEMLPGLYFSNEEMFFIAAAQNTCEEHTAEGLEVYLKDQHSTPHARVLGVYKNLDAFSQAFNCPPGSPMNPINKCHFQ